MDGVLDLRVKCLKLVQCDYLHAMIKLMTRRGIRKEYFL